MTIADERIPAVARHAGHPLVIVGGGPAGLAAAAQAHARGIPTVVLEAGPTGGSAVLEWGHVRLFSPWSELIDPVAEKLLTESGWTSTDPASYPTGRDWVERYLAPLAALLAQQPGVDVHYGHQVVGVARAGRDRLVAIGRDDVPFTVHVSTPEGRKSVTACAVIDASGTWGRRNPLGAAGLPAVGEDEAGPWLVGPLPDVLGRERQRFAGRHTLVVGMGHSAANTLLALVELQRTEPDTRISWAIRGRSPARLYGGGDSDGLPARGLLGSTLKAAVQAGHVELHREVTITHLSPVEAGQVQVTGAGRDGAPLALTVDAVAAATGFRPDLDMLREVRLDLDPGVEAPARLAPLIDPNLHSCGTVPPHGHRDLAHPDEDLYLVGMKSYGRAPTFLLATGYEQVRSIAAALAGDIEAADSVQLHLPSTGVCSTDLGAREAAETSGLGFTTGSEHGFSAEQPEAAGCCGSTPQPVTIGAPASSC